MYKNALVSPLFKKGDKTKSNNYRPDSKLSEVGKILESILEEELQKYIENNKLFPKDQPGLSKNHSTSTLLNSMINDVSQNVLKENVQELKIWTFHVHSIC